VTKDVGGLTRTVEISLSDHLALPRFAAVVVSLRAGIADELNAVRSAPTAGPARRPRSWRLLSLPASERRELARETTVECNWHGLSITSSRSAAWSS